MGDIDVLGGSEGEQGDGTLGEGSSKSADGDSGIGSSSCRVQCFSKAQNLCEDANQSLEGCWVLLSSLSW